MPPVRKPPNLSPDDIPLLEDVVEPAQDATSSATVPEPEPVADSVPDMPYPAAPVAESLPLEILSEVLTERITALTDRLLRDASAEIHATLVSKVWEKLREEIPELVEAALREHDGGR
ncbi:MAG TPA: hypothetical protein VFM15_07055 [Gammaproteobacteria bacterium]|nr:hypothetical protein [Gammaproteobacteria bacterium]